MKALDEGFVPAGEDARRCCTNPIREEEVDLLDALRKVSTTLQRGRFRLDTLRAHIEHDIEILEKILQLVEPITPEQDAKLQTLIKRLGEEPLKSGKRLIFTQYADTARYLFDNLNPSGKQRRHRGDFQRRQEQGPRRRPIRSEGQS